MMVAKFIVQSKMWCGSRLTLEGSESISYGSIQEVHLFCEDKALGGVDSMIQNASELLVAFMDIWESKQLFILAKVVDFANIPSSGGDSSDVNTDHLPIVDWSTIEIAAIEDGSMDDPTSQEKMCLALGINENSILHPPSPIVSCVVDKEMLTEAVIAVDDNMPEELNISYDIDHPTIEVRTMFPSMTDCRMAIRQFAINEEFDLGTKKADRTRWSGEYILHDNIRHVVNIATHECTCLRWQHTGKPCWHALVFLIGKRNVPLENYVHEYYSLDKFRAAYQGEVEPLTDKLQWPKVDLGFVMYPPRPKVFAGRRRKNRIKSFLEGGGSKSKAKGNEKEKEVKRLGSQNRCKKCGVLGHRQNTCPTNGVRKRKIKSKKNSSGGALTIDGAAARAACVELQNAESSLTAQCTPKKNSAVATLQASPGPVTRRKLSLAMAEDAAFLLCHHQETSRRLLPRR
uniref:Uncharacterized protein n=1 Tax=Avena sativa TaxID=4498 RepID=A0ACD5ZL15_AVESA